MNPDSRIVKQYPIRQVNPLREPVFYGFPREAGLKLFNGAFSRRFIESEEDFIRYINVNRGKDVLISLYSFRDWNQITNRPFYENARITKLQYDFDGQREWDRVNGKKGKMIKDRGRALQDLRKAVLWASSEGIRRVIMDSGSGFHLYLWLNRQPKFGKPTLKAIAYDIIDKQGLMVDTQALADVARFGRVPGSWNTSGRRWVRCLSSEQVITGKLPASKIPSYQIIYEGNKLLPIDEYDIERNITKKEYGYIHDPHTSEMYEDLYDLDELLEKVGIPHNILPPCINSLLNDKEMNYITRSNLVFFLKEMSLTPDEILNVFKIVLNDEKYNHMIDTHFDRSMEANFSPSCLKLRTEGYCDGGNKCHSNSPTSIARQNMEKLFSLK